MALVTRLKATEHGDLIDRPLLDGLYSALGAEVLNEIIQDTLFEAQDRIQQVKDYEDFEDLDTLSRIAHGLKGMTSQVGLTRMASIANDLEECCANADTHAACAVAERLVRIGRESINAMTMIRY